MSTESCLEPRDIAASIEALLELVSDQPYMLYDRRWDTWNNIRSIAESTRAELAEFPPDAVVGVLCRNQPLVLGAVLGLLASRRCIFPLSSLAGDSSLASEIMHIRPSALLVADRDWPRREILSAAESIGALTMRVPATLGDQLTSQFGPVRIVDRSGAPQYPAGTAFVLQTSGTTGPAKRVPVTYRNLTAAVHSMRSQVREVGALDQPRLRRSVAILNTSLSHTSGMLAFCLNIMEGRRLALLDRFEPVRWAELVRDFHVRSAGVPPAALAMLLDADVDPNWLSSLLMIRSGTAPLDPELAVRFEARFGIPVVQAYGATEFQGIASWTLPDYREWIASKRGSVGRAHTGVELRVTDPESGVVRPAAAGGRLEVRTAQASVETPNGWVKTNDLARIDEDGFLWILGRTDDVINRGGLKVDAVAVAHALESHPWVIAAAVVGIPDARLGEVPCAAIVLSPDAPQPTPELLEKSLGEYLRDRLTPYMLPARYEVVDALPRNDLLKINRPAVKALFQ